MTSDEIRAIVREEIHEWYRDLCAAQAAADAQWRARHDEAWKQRLADDPADGPFVKKLKAAMRSHP